MGTCLEAVEGILKTTADYIDALRVKLNVDSDYKAMNALGVKHRQQVSQWRKLHGSFDEHLSLKVADALGIDRAEVLLAMQVQRESDVELKLLWQRIATLSAAHAGMLTVAGLAVIMSALYPHMINAESIGYAVVGFTSNIHYASAWYSVEFVIFSLFFIACYLAFPRHNSPK